MIVVNTQLYENVIKWWGSLNKNDQIFGYSSPELSFTFDKTEIFFYMRHSDSIALLFKNGHELLIKSEPTTTFGMSSGTMSEKSVKVSTEEVSEETPKETSKETPKETPKPVSEEKS